MAGGGCGDCGYRVEHEFSFRHAQVELPVRYTSGDSEYSDRECKRIIAKDADLEVINV